MNRATGALRALAVKMRHRARCFLENKIPAVGWARLCCSPAVLWSIAVLFVLAIHDRTSVRRQRCREFAPRFSSYPSFPKKQLVARFNQRNSNNKWWGNLEPSLIDTIIDAYVIPEGIVALISNPEVLKGLRHAQDFRFPTAKTEELVQSETCVLYRSGHFCRGSKRN
jgi:hypothetical protein